MVLLSKKLYLFFIFLVFAAQNTTRAQAAFTATISPGTIGKNETAELRLMVENARQVEQIIPPSLKDFIILSGPNQESGMESVNGVTRQFIGITYQLKPRASGKFSIAGAVAKADGKTLKSNLVVLQVTKTSSGTSQANTSAGFSGLSSLFAEPAVQSSFKDYIIKKGENIPEKINKNIFIKVDISKPTCFIGEPVVVTYKLYTRLKSESNITKNPSFNGFSVIDLSPPGNNYYSIEKLNGREYNVYTLRKSQLYPLQAGTAEVESAEVENNIHFIKEEYLKQQANGLDDMFREFAQTAIPAEGVQDEKVTLQSKPAVITVKALPEKEKPLFFKGAVGNFTLEAGLEKNTFTTDDAGDLKVAVYGQGNMTMVNAPDINWPDGIEPYEPQTKEQLNKLAIPVSGTKVFEYPFTVTKPGVYKIPSIEFSFFNVKEGRYKTITTPPLTLTVAKGIGKRPLPEGSNIKTNTKENFFETLFINRWLIIVPLAVLLLAGLLLWLQKDNKIQIVAARKNLVVPLVTETAIELNKLAVNPLSLTEEKMASRDTRGYYEALNNEVRKFLADHFQIGLSTLNKKRIAEEADKKGIAVQTCLQIQQLLDDMEWQLYTPFGGEDKMQEMYSQADAVIHALNKEPA